MNCYDCIGDGRTTPAVAICTSCGAALCGEHTRLETQDHTQAATPGNPSHHRTRALICAGCDGVLRGSAAPGSARKPALAGQARTRWQN